MATEFADQETRTPSWLPVVLAVLIPVFGYGLAFSYESGFATAYGYPGSLIAVQGSSLYGGISFAALLIVLMVLLVEFTSPFLVRSLSPVRDYLRPMVFWLATFGLLLFSARLHIRLGLPWLPIVLAILFIYSLGPLMALNARGYAGKIRAFMEEATLVRPSLLREFTSRVGRRSAGGLLVLGICLICSNIYGQSSAADQTDYLVTTIAGREEIVLRIFGNTAILAPLDRKRHTIESTFTLLQLNAQTVEMRRESVGPLQLLGRA